MTIGFLRLGPYSLQIKATPHQTTSKKAASKDIKAEGVQILCPEDGLYPALLKEIYDPPLALYLKGDLSFLDKINISVVGCRRASFNGLV